MVGLLIHGSGISRSRTVFQYEIPGLRSCIPEDFGIQKRSKSCLLLKVAVDRPTCSLNIHCIYRGVDIYKTVHWVHWAWHQETHCNSTQLYGFPKSQSDTLPRFSVYKAATTPSLYSSCHCLCSRNMVSHSSVIEEYLCVIIQVKLKAPCAL